MTVKGVKALAACPLERLACRSCERCDDAWLQALAGVATLTHVDVRKNHLVTHAGRAALSAAVAVSFDVDVVDGWGDDLCGYQPLNCGLSSTRVEERPLRINH